MNKKRWMAFVLLLLPSALLADTVYLKGGEKISGRIVTRTETGVQVDVGAGTIDVSMTNVDRIVEEPSPLSEYAKRAAALGPRDVNGWRALGRWASSQGLNTQARQAYEKVLTLAPGDVEANQALGQVQVGGRWVSEEESYRFPFSIETGAVGRPERLKIGFEEIEVNPSLDEARFQMPTLER